MTDKRVFDGEELLIASHNPKKIEEISALLKGKVKRFSSAASLNLAEPEETGTSFDDNAILKARAMAKESGLPALADDSGFCVSILDGAPGIYSARYAINPETGARDFNYGMEKLWAEAQAKQKQERYKAYFVCVLALAWPDGHVETARGEVQGEMVWPPRGELGFGYDPIFVPAGYDQSFAEMPAHEKRQISHRSRAFDVLIANYFAD